MGVRIVSVNGFPTNGEEVMVGRSRGVEERRGHGVTGFRCDRDTLLPGDQVKVLGSHHVRV